jgi:UDP-N-acetyl-D-mannosaminuronic acid dehydrogenase
LLKPGAGVGGHCLVKDTLHLERGYDDFDRYCDNAAFGLGGGTRRESLFMLSRKINDYMPYHMADLTEYGVDVRERLYGIKKNRLKLSLLGFSFAANTSDDRNTPSLYYYWRMKNASDNRIYDISIHDPYVKSSDYKIETNLEFVLKDSDIIVIMIGHNDYVNLTPDYVNNFCNNHAIIVDGRNIIDPIQFIKSGFVYMGIGRGDVMNYE